MLLKAAFTVPRRSVATSGIPVLREVGEREEFDSVARR
jgi:hypothetical protein